MICSSISLILPRDCAATEIDCARSPLSRAASRSSEISRLSCTRFLFHSPPHAFELATDQLELFRFCCLQRGIAADFLVELRDALLELRLLAEPGAAPQLEQLALACDRGGDVGLVAARQQGGGKVDLLGL